MLNLLKKWAEIQSMKKAGSLVQSIYGVPEPTLNVLSFTSPRTSLYETTFLSFLPFFFLSFF